MSLIRRHGSPAPNVANADLSRAVQIALEQSGVPCVELRGENGGRMVIGAIEPTGRLVLAEILGAGSPYQASRNGCNSKLRAAGAIVVAVHDQMALVMLLDTIRRLKDEQRGSTKA